MQTLQKATFAGGCFWCLEPAFVATQEIEVARVGFTGGTLKNPSYEQVLQGDTGHYEAIEISFKQERISYRELVDIFWKQIDPTDLGGQFSDRGNSYKTAIFYHDLEQKKIAEETKEQLDRSGIFAAPIVTKILPAQEFYPAQEYHQAYYKKHPQNYKLYRSLSGRQRYLEKMWSSKV